MDVVLVLAVLCVEKGYIEVTYKALHVTLYCRVFCV